MPSVISNVAVSVSPIFTITGENFILDHFQTVTRIDIDGVQPPLLGADGGYSTLMDMLNEWFPWLDEKIVEPKYDGVCFYLGIPSNQPTYIKDYHTLAMFRAADRVLSPRYDGLFRGTVDTPSPTPPPVESAQE
jgi:hypothetical protein